MMSRTHCTIPTGSFSLRHSPHGPAVLSRRECQKLYRTTATSSAGASVAERSMDCRAPRFSARAPKVHDLLSSVVDGRCHDFYQTSFASIHRVSSLLETPCEPAGAGES